MHLEMMHAILYTTQVSVVMNKASISNTTYHDIAFGIMCDHEVDNPWFFGLHR